MNVIKTKIISLKLAKAEAKERRWNQHSALCIDSAMIVHRWLEK